jgi:putative glutamine amidotransferase
MKLNLFARRGDQFLEKRVLLPYREFDRAQPYVRAMSEVGVQAVTAPPQSEVNLADFSGLLLMGGTDVAPSHYGEHPVPETDDEDPERDAFEAGLLEKALAADMPILAICRGMQLLNVVQGGSLVQHLDTVGRHRRVDTPRHVAVHNVSIASGTLLSRIAGENEWGVNSRHHQAIKRLGAGLSISAVDSEDGTIEAVEQADRRFTLGVQWHPEDQALMNSKQLKLFQAFAEVLPRVAGTLRRVENK